MIYAENVITLKPAIIFTLPKKIKVIVFVIFNSWNIIYQNIIFLFIKLPQKLIVEISCLKDFQQINQYKRVKHFIHSRMIHESRF